MREGGKISWSIVELSVVVFFFLKGILVLLLFCI